MKENSFSRIKMHTNFLKGLLEDRNTPITRIKFESIMLTDMLKKFRASGGKAPKSEMDSIYQVLIKVQSLLEEEATTEE